MKRVIEVFLRLLEAVGVGGGLAPQDLLDHPEAPCQREDLRLVEAGDGLHVGGAVAQLDEEALVILEPVGRPRDGVVEPIGVVVLQHLPRALLEVGGRDDLEICARGEPVLALIAVPDAHHQLDEMQRLGAERIARQHDFPRHLRPELGDDLAHRLVARLVAAGRIEDGCDVLDLVADAQLLAERLAVGEALRARVALRQQQRKDALRPARAHAQGGHARRVYAA